LFWSVFSAELFLACLGAISSSRFSVLAVDGGFLGSGVNQ
jgi:hypothetical protein